VTVVTEEPLRAYCGTGRKHSVTWLPVSMLSVCASVVLLLSTRLELGDRAFSAAGPRVWNRLPTEQKAITNTRVLGANLNLNLFYVCPHTINAH